MNHVKDEIKERLNALYEELHSLQDDIWHTTNEIEDLEQQLEYAED